MTATLSPANHPAYPLPKPAITPAELERTEKRILESIDEIPDDHRIILLMGKTRAGKSTFINDLIGKDIMETSDSMLSVTKEMAYATTRVDYAGRLQNIAIVDTIGFSGSDEDHNEPEILNAIIQKLTSRRHKLVTGIIFLANINESAMNRDTIDHLEMFKDVVGGDIMKSVMFLTSKWNPEAEKKARRTQVNTHIQLETVHWREYKDAGARIERLDEAFPRPDPEDLDAMTANDAEFEIANYRTNVMRILGLVLDSVATEETQIQKEVQDVLDSGDLASVASTTAGKTVVEHMEREARAAQRAGLDATAKFGAIEKFQNTQIQALTSMSQRFIYASDVGEKAFGPMGALGGVVNNAVGEGYISSVGLVVGKKRREALSKQYGSEMVQYAAGTTLKGAQMFEDAVPDIMLAKPMARIAGATGGLWLGMARNVYKTADVVLNPDKYNQTDPESERDIIDPPTPPDFY